MDNILLFLEDINIILSQKISLGNYNVYAGYKLNISKTRIQGYCLIIQVKLHANMIKMEHQQMLQSISIQRFFTTI